MKILFLILIFVLFIPSVIASDNFYSVSGNEIISNDFKIILNEKIISNVLIDSNNIYYYTTNYFYGSDKDDGTINFKVGIKDINGFNLADNYIYLYHINGIYQITKSGNINRKYLYTDNIESLFTKEDIAYETIVNNTNLAPTIHPSIIGTGERVDNETYWANISEIEIHVFAHADNTSQTAGTFLYINDTLISARSGRPLAIAETAYRGIDTRIPKGAYYRVDFENYHHYEWREYPILTGRNGTLSINQTNNYNTTISDSQLNLKVNKSGDTMNGTLEFDKNTQQIAIDTGNINMTWNTFHTGTGGRLNKDARTDINLFPGISNGTSDFTFFRNTNSTGCNGFNIYVGNNSGFVNDYFSGNCNSYFSRYLGGVAIGQSTVTSGYKLDVADSVRIQNNLTLASSGSCINMKDGAGTNYKIQIIAGSLTATAGSC